MFKSTTALYQKPKAKETYMKGHKIWNSLQNAFL